MFACIISGFVLKRYSMSKLLIVSILIALALILAALLYPRKIADEKSLSECTIENFYTVEENGYSVAPYIQHCTDKMKTKTLLEWCELRLANSEKACD